MKQPDFAGGVLVAALLAALAAMVSTVFGLAASVHALVPGLGLAYLLYLFSRSAERTGRPSTLAVWSALCLLAWWIAPPLPLYLALHALALWLVRSLYFHTGFAGALLDLCLGALALLALGWAWSRTGSVFLAAWCFFLLQALFVLIPRSPQAASAPEGAEQRFQRAHHAAQAALDRLLNH